MTGISWRPPNVASSDPQTAAVDLIVGLVDASYWPRDPAEQRKLLRRAKAAAHPDINDGRRVLWDRVEHAAEVLGVQ